MKTILKEKNPKRKAGRNRTPFLFLLVLLTIILNSFINYKQKLGASPQVVIKDKTISINGIIIPNKCKKSELISLIGEPSRSIVKSEAEIKQMIKEFGTEGNNIYVYDNIGFYFYESITEKTITGISIQYIKTNYTHSPYKEFAGILTIENSLIKKECTLDCFRNNSKISFKKEQFNYQMTTLNREFTIQFIQLGKLEVVRTIDIELGLKTKESDSDMFTQHDVRIFRTALINSKEFNEQAKKYNLDIEKIADCYAAKILKSSKKEIMSGSIESQNKLGKYVADCFVEIAEKK